MEIRTRMGIMGFFAVFRPKVPNGVSPSKKSRISCRILRVYLTDAPFIYTNTCTSMKMVYILTSYVQVNILYRDAKIQVSKHTTMQRSTYIHFTKIHIRIHTISNYWIIWTLIPIPWKLPKEPTKRGSSVSLIFLKTTYLPIRESPGPMWSIRFPGWPFRVIYIRKTPREPPSPPSSGPLPARQVRHLLLRPSFARSMARRAGRLAITSLSHEEPKR